METPEIFGPRRANFMRVYEILVVAEDLLPRTRLLQAAHVGQQEGAVVFNWKLEQGYLEKLTNAEAAGHGKNRKVSRAIKGFFRITVRGREIRNAYEALFDLIGLSDRVHDRFPWRQYNSVKTHRVSGLRTRT